jgi:hypothetical protein
MSYRRWSATSSVSSHRVGSRTRESESRFFSSYSSPPSSWHPPPRTCTRDECLTDDDSSAGLASGSGRAFFATRCSGGGGFESTSRRLLGSRPCCNYTFPLLRTHSPFYRLRCLLLHRLRRCSSLSSVLRPFLTHCSVRSSPLSIPIVCEDTSGGIACRR